MKLEIQSGSAETGHSGTGLSAQLQTVCRYEDWSKTSLKKPIVHIQLGKTTLPVMREDGWNNFTDVAKSMEQTALRLGENLGDRHSWMNQKDWQPGESLLCAGRVLFWKSDTEAAFGTLVVSDHRFSFLPIDGSLKGALEWDSPRVERIQRAHLDIEQLLIREEKREVLFTPLAGAEFCEAVQEALGIASDTGVDSSLDGGQPVSSILGEAVSIRVFTRGDLLREIKAGQIIGLDESYSYLGLVFPGIATSVLEERPTLRMEVRRWDAIYQFEADVNAVHRCPAYIEKQLGQSAFIVAFYAPLDIRRFNRREAFRVQLVEPLGVKFSTGNVRVDGEMLDLSTEGCAFSTTEILEKGAEGVLSVPVGRLKMNLNSTIRNCSTRRDSSGGWRYGVRFSDVGAEELERLQDMVMRFQRDLLADVADRRIFL